MVKRKRETEVKAEMGREKSAGRTKRPNQSGGDKRKVVPRAICAFRNSGIWSCTVSYNSHNARTAMCQLLAHPSAPPASAPATCRCLPPARTRPGCPSSLPTLCLTPPCPAPARALWVRKLLMACSVVPRSPRSVPVFLASPSPPSTHIALPYA